MSNVESSFLFYWRVLAQNEPELVREYRFDDKRRWRFDFAWPEQKVAVELHGATYARGRHTRGGGFDADREKMNAAQLAGWIVLEFSSKQLTDDPTKCVEQIKRALRRTT